MESQLIINFLEELAPPSLQESYDNSGWIVKLGKTCNKALISLDCTPEVIEEARQLGCDLVIAHHPILFKGMKRLTEEHYTEIAIIQAIRSNISLYAIHTNLDNVLHNGINQALAQRIGLENLRILRPMKGHLCKLVIYSPKKETEQVERAMFEAGAGQIGNYSECSFLTNGTGSFTPNSLANPHSGNANQRSIVNENKIEVLVESWKLNQVLQAAKNAHPYEEVAYDVIQLENFHQEVGSGLIGSFPSPVPVQDFLARLKEVLSAQHLKFTAPTKSSIQHPALCGGAGSFLLNDAIRAGADAFLTADLKYHEYFDALGKLMCIDAGHYETEHHVAEHLSSLLKEKFPNFATLISQVNTNPVNYY